MPRDDRDREEVSIALAGETNDADRRIHEVLEISRDEIAALVGGAPLEIARVDGGLTNTLHRVRTRDGSFAVKHYAGGEGPYRDELVTLQMLHGRLPVPEVVHADDARFALVYRWVEGTTLDDCRRKQAPAAFASLADPLGRLLAWMAEVEAPGAWELAPILERARALLVGPSRARERLGAPTCEALVRAFDDAGDALGWGSRCLSHGDFGSRNLIVQAADPKHERWRIAGVIDWETMAAGAPLVDIGALFRYGQRYDQAFRDDFARGYREAGGADLPDDWFSLARLLDATWLVETLDEPSEMPGVFADCRQLIGRLVVERVRV